MLRYECLTLLLKKYVLHYENVQLRLKPKSQWLKLYVEFNAQKRVETEKNGSKDGKVLYKLMNNAVYGRTMENLRNRIDIGLEKDCLE